jgi:putative tricarboxylic transport membrane protein
MILDVLWIGTVKFFSVNNMLICFGGTLTGTIFGALPAFTASMGVAVLLPFTYYMSPEGGLLLMASLYVGAMYGGSIPAILMHTPGTPGAAATVLDGYEMAKKGQADLALAISMSSSAVAGLIGGILLCIGGPVLSFYAAKISPGEIFVLVLLGLIMLGNLAAEDPPKGFMGGILGMLLGTVGVDYIEAHYRFTFGVTELYDGLPLVATLVGLLALSECFTMVREGTGKPLSALVFDFSYRRVFKEMWKTVAGAYAKATYLGTFIGCVIGIIPGEGAAVANFVAYDQAKRFSDHPELFGRGSPDGVAAPEAANNSVVPLALLPALSLGIPGSSTAALILAGAMMHGVRPGPGVFDRHPDVMGVLLVGILASSLLQIVVGLILVRPSVKLAQIRSTILAGVVLCLAVIGVYSLSYEVFDIGVMVVFALLGYGLKRAGIPPVTTVVGFILGPLLERNFITALSISGGNYGIFFFRPVAAVLWLFIIFSLVYPWWRARRKQPENGPAEKGGAAYGKNAG